MEEVSTEMVEQFADTVREIGGENSASCVKSLNVTLVSVLGIAGAYLLGRRAIRMIENRGRRKQRELDKLVVEVKED